jgi:transcriptional regulator with XRE-family HTH domain
MAGHERRDERAERAARQALADIGRQVREARLAHDLSQREAARAIGFSAATWSRLEQGASPSVSLVTLGRALAVVGLDLHVRAFPGGAPLRDAAHVRLLERLRERLPASVAWRTEVPLPAHGDRRAWDAVIGLTDVRVGVEGETRARDAQELQRRIALKQRDGGMDHVLLLLADTRHNRHFLRTCGTGFLSAFPVDRRLALRRLEAGTDPQGCTILLL